MTWISEDCIVADRANHAWVTESRRQIRDGVRRETDEHDQNAGMRVLSS